MTLPTEKEVKWFVKELIKLREKVNGHYTAISFQLSGLKEYEDENETDLPGAELKDRVFWMLEQIKKHYIKTKNPTLVDNLTYEQDAVDIKINDGYDTQMLEDYLYFIKKEETPKKQKEVLIKFKTKGKDFELNINDGNFKLGNTNGQFSPETQLFKILHKLAMNRNQGVEYGNLLEIVKKGNLKTNRNYIATILKKIKKEMGILDTNRREKNPDIFENISGFGYKISSEIET